MSANFKINNISNFYPVGSVVQYCGTTDPDGWIICDGTTRTATDSRYAALATMLGGSNTANSITPPDLRGKIIRGANSDTEVTNTGGSTTMTLAVTNLPPHTHSGTTNTAGNHSHTWRTSYFGGGSQLHHPNVDGCIAKGLDNYTGGGSAVLAGGDHTHTISIGNGNGAATTINSMPPFYTVNHIIKYY
jgi:microcystin-dependent protein